MQRRRPAPADVNRVLLLGGTSEIGLEILAALGLPGRTEILLAGRDEQRLAAAGKALVEQAQDEQAQGGQVRTLHYDATALDTHQAVIDEAFAAGDVDLVISAAGILTAQDLLDRDPLTAGRLVETNFTGHVTALLAFGEAMRRRGSGTIVVLSSVAAVRPRKFNSVYGATKAALDAFARGYADSLHGTGVRVLLVRPGFVIGKKTEGMAPAPLATTPAAVGVAVARALRGSQSVVWVPAPLAGLATVMKLIPRPVWRKMKS